jgi:plastocyanin
MSLLRRVWIPATLAALACGGNGSSTGPGNGGGEAPGEVSVGDNFFQPATATVTRQNGQATVTWNWIGRNLHNVTFDLGEPNSATQRSGSFSRTFAEPGSFTYICTIHGRAAMSGTVVVE